MTNETNWTIDPSHSEIAFKVRHLMIAHTTGTFKIFDASITVTDKNFSTAEIDLWIDAASITTGDAKRDEHLISAEFFDAAAHKQITFTSGTIGKADDKGLYELWGDLTIRGISKKIKLKVAPGGIVTDPWGNERAGFTVTGKINRSEWGLTWNTVLETGGIMVGEEVTISCEVELINRGEKDKKMELEVVADDKKIF